MLRRSNRNPDSMNAGMKVTSIVSWLATSWFLTQEEISRPMPSATSTYSIEAPSSTHSEPRSGT